MAVCVRLPEQDVMKQDLGCGAILILCLTGTTGASAFELRHQAGGVDMQVNLGLIVQGAVYQTPTSDAPIPPILTEGRINAWGAFNAEWTSPTGWLFGAHIEGDTDQARSDTIKNDKIYVYIASDYGRLEVGREYGAARRLS